MNTWYRAGVVILHCEGNFGTLEKVCFPTQGHAQRGLDAELRRCNRCWYSRLNPH